MSLLARIAWVGGSLLLVGRSGVGRRSSVSIVAQMHRMEVFSPNMTLNYGKKDFQNDLKELIKSSGIEGKSVVLYLEGEDLKTIPGTLLCSYFSCINLRRNVPLCTN